MARKRDLSNLPADMHGKGVQFNVRLSQRQHDLVTAGAAHTGLSVSSYVRWLIETGTSQVLAAPSKADKLKDMTDKMARMMPPLEPIPEHAIVKPRDPATPESVVVHAPTNFKPLALNSVPSPLSAAKVVTGLDEPRTFGQPATPPLGVPARLPPLQAQQLPPPAPSALHALQSPPTKPAKVSMELSLEEFEAFYVRAHEPGPKPLELPDDMSDWT